MHEAAENTDKVLILMHLQTPLCDNTQTVHFKFLKEKKKKILRLVWLPPRDVM